MKTPQERAERWWKSSASGPAEQFDALVESFAEAEREIRADQRERDARVCEELRTDYAADLHVEDEFGWERGTSRCAEAIRAAKDEVSGG